MLNMFVVWKCYCGSDRLLQFLYDVMKCFRLWPIYTPRASFSPICFTIEPNTKWIGRPVAEIWLFEIFQDARSVVGRQYTLMSCTLRYVKANTHRRRSKLKVCIEFATSWRQSRRVWTNLPTTKSSCVVSAVCTHPSAVVTQFTILQP